ncbi:hypothetical protein KMW28_01510 [Flammeovirga yaeyamensis]|uniref:Uncharacterized protein n=1 Tax=Flammeovirga yaeyamensis TaxID=367791 RepID=A0AAX1N8D2_9BACT|nr:hypothetical protein [Flammeovirga yaeyamensis]MBB3699763.1 hypothetical protein [Flammeovirga yaeyamensis]NMF36668.1 hypothetical protein [Flammeovirga yaeyamensis]QWG02287.1 hypothetical protein KMW28_01510 [Flammeovirga yaeyamensis]
MNLLIGKDNSLNNKLIEQIYYLTPIKRVELNDILEQKITSRGYIFVNLLDVDLPSSKVLSIIKNKFPNDCIVAMHCFQVDHMINNLMEEGYNAYISILDFSEDLSSILP